MVPLPTHAHAQLVSSSPKVSATLYVSPTTIALAFDDDLIQIPGANLIEVSDPKNRKVQSESAQVTGSKLTVKLKKSSVLGRYKVLWRALSSDGHPVSGFYYFYLAKKK
jgi:methionine-rich copper-binding protein CopC